MGGRGSFAGEVAQTFTTNLAITGLQVFTGILLARLLGPEGRGELVAIQALPMIVAAVGMLGLHDAMIYFTGRNPDDAGKNAVSATVLIVIAAIPITAIAALLTPLFLRSQPETTVRASQVYLGLVFVYALLGLSGSTARAMHRITLWNRLRIVPTALWLVVIVFCWLAFERRPAVLAFVYLGLFLLASVAMIGVVRRVVRTRWTLDTKLWRPMLRYGLPVALGAAPQLMNQRLDQLLIAGMLPQADLGHYAVALSWSSLATMPAVAIGGVAFSKIAGIRDPTAQRALIRKSSVSSTLLGIAAASLLAASGPFVIPIVFTEEFRPAVLLAAILVLAAVLRGLTTILGTCMKAVGRPSAVLYSQSAGLVGLVLTAPWLIRHLGAPGAAWAVTISSSAAAVVVLWFAVTWFRHSK
jgi:O-antigen/teichoic acid export membrane protein